MKINDVLEAVNQAIDNERSYRNLDIKGHFISTIEIKKSMGPYKQCYINIIYVDIPNKNNIPFVNTSFMERVLVDHIDELIRSTSIIALVKFTLALHYKDNWDKIIRGEYGSK